jgi:hypothetical protein
MYGQTGSGKTFTMESIEELGVLQLFEHTIAASTREAAAVRVRVAFFEIAGKRCFDLLHHTRREIFLKDSEDGYVILQVWNPSGRGPRATLCGTGVLPFTNTSGLLGSLLWFRPGLCQCRFRIAQISPLVPPKLRQYRSKPAAQLLPIRPVTKLRFVVCFAGCRGALRGERRRVAGHCRRGQGAALHACHGRQRFVVTQPRRPADHRGAREEPRGRRTRDMLH